MATAIHSKRFRAARDEVDRTHHYPPAEAIALLKRTAGAKFDETVELHIRLGVNVRHADEQLRGTLPLPNGLGKDVTVAVFAEGDAARAAQEAGADHVGGADLAEKVEEGWTDFDVAISTPALMGPVVSKLGRVLGPQGKMPNPKVGTVTDDVAKAIAEAKAGKVEYRTDRQAIIHLSIGKASFDERALLENYAAVVDEIVRAKPAAAKGRYLLSITLATSMGPGIRVDTSLTREGEILSGVAEDDGNTPKAARASDEVADPAEEPAAPAASQPDGNEAEGEASGGDIPEAEGEASGGDIPEAEGEASGEDIPEPEVEEEPAAQEPEAEAPEASE